MPSVISDASIIIDIGAGGLLPEMFGVPGLVFHVPDVLFEEELKDQLGMLPDMGLRVEAQAPEAIAYVQDLSRRYRGPSTNDLFALALAHTLGCPLLTGDRALREAATAEGVEVHGTLWLMEAMWDAGLITVDRARAAYAAMREQGSRLPWGLVEEQLQRWSERAA